MYILSDGKKYVAENPLQVGKYLSSTSTIQGMEFTYKQAKSLLQKNKSSLAWIRDYHMVNTEANEKETNEKENNIDTTVRRIFTVMRKNLCLMNQCLT